MGTMVEATVLDLIQQGLEASHTETFPECIARAFNEQGVKELIWGDAQQALDSFLHALEQSSTDDLRGACLINIGDLTRRVDGDVDLARRVFAIASELISDTLLISRLYAMQAMTHILVAECGENRPEGEAEHAKDLLETAIGLAQLAQMKSPDEGLEAESFAFHRLAGIICHHGSKREQEEFAHKRIPDFINRLDAKKHIAEIARLCHSRAICLVNLDTKYRLAAIDMMLTSARNIEPSSPLEAYSYYGKAAEWLASEDRIDEAWESINKADQYTNLIGARKSTEKIREQCVAALLKIAVRQHTPPGKEI